MDVCKWFDCVLIANGRQGLEPVVSVAMHNGNTMMNTGEELEYTKDQLRSLGRRDIASAPF